MTVPPDSPPAGSADGGVEELIARLEAESRPSTEHRFESEFLALLRETRGAGRDAPDALLAETIAWRFMAAYPDNGSGWGLYFGPMMSGVRGDGTPWDDPSLGDVSADMLAYWRERASATSHPAMRARYADLLWELPRKLPGVRRDAGMARVAITAYLDAVAEGRYEEPIEAADKVRRALDIALTLNEREGIGRAVALLFELEDRDGADDSPGLWGNCFALVLDRQNRRLILTDDQRDKALRDMEARLQRFADREPARYLPDGALHAARPLAEYYRAAGRPDDMTRVLRTYGGVVLRMRDTAHALVWHRALADLYELYQEFRMTDDADELNESLRVAGQAAVQGMSSHEVEVEVPREQIEAWFDEVLSLGERDLLLRLAAEFLPRRGEVEERLKRLAAEHPLPFLVTRQIVDETGRTVAEIGGVGDDHEAHLARQISEELQFGAPLLREAICRAMDQGKLSVEGVLAYIGDGALFPATRAPLIRRGVEAWAAADFVSALHVLIPQVEHALRQLAVIVGTALYRPGNAGGLNARMLGDLLNDELIKQALGPDIATYLFVLLADARGWNLRNNVCHGLAAVGDFNPATGDRVIHALLVLASVRLSEPAADPPPPGEAPATGPAGSADPADGPGDGAALRRATAAPPPATGASRHASE